MKRKEGVPQPPLLKVPLSYHHPKARWNSPQARTGSYNALPPHVPAALQGWARSPTFLGSFLSPLHGPPGVSTPGPLLQPHRCTKRLGLLPFCSLMCVCLLQCFARDSVHQSWPFATQVQKHFRLSADNIHFSTFSGSF